MAYERCLGKSTATGRQMHALVDRVVCEKEGCRSLSDGDGFPEPGREGELCKSSMPHAGVCARPSNLEMVHGLNPRHICQSMARPKQVAVPKGAPVTPFDLRSR